MLYKVFPSSEIENNEPTPWEKIQGLFLRHLYKHFHETMIYDLFLASFYFNLSQNEVHLIWSPFQNNMKTQTHYGQELA